MLIYIYIYYIHVSEVLRSCVDALFFFPSQAYQLAEEVVERIARVMDSGMRAGCVCVGGGCHALGEGGAREPEGENSSATQKPQEGEGEGREGGGGRERAGEDTWSQRQRGGEGGRGKERREAAWTTGRTSRGEGGESEGEWFAERRSLEGLQGVCKEALLERKVTKACE